MAGHKQQQQDSRAGLQHLANLQQEASVPPVALVHQRRCHLPSEHNPWQAEAALEAHLQRQRQAGEQHQ